MLEIKWNGRPCMIGYCACGTYQIEYTDGLQPSEEHATADFFDEHGGNIINIAQWYACNHCVNHYPIVYGESEDFDETE